MNLLDYAANSKSVSEFTLDEGLQILKFRNQRFEYYSPMKLDTEVMFTLIERDTESFKDLLRNFKGHSNMKLQRQL